MTTSTIGELREIPLTELVVHQANTRRAPGDLKELADSIRQHGIITPLVAVPENGHYALIDGSRRFAAAKLAGAKTAPVYVRDPEEIDAQAQALVANLHRQDLTPLEEAEGYRAWLALYPGKTQRELAAAVGRDESTVSNSLRLLAAPKPVRDALAARNITATHARVALELKDPSLASSLKMRPGITVDELKGQVDRANATYQTKGEGAKAAIKRAHADAQAKHPNAVITWGGSRYTDAASVSSVLGRAPAKVVNRIGKISAVTEAQHDKKCSCRAYELSARPDWGGGRRLVTELDRVCIDPKGYAAAKPKPRKEPKRKAAATTKPKEPTPAQVAKREAAARKERAKKVSGFFSLPKLTPAGAAVFKKLRNAQIPADVARAVLATEASLGLYGVGDVADEIHGMAWERILKMPAKKLSELAISKLVLQLHDEVLRGGSHMDPDTYEGRVAAYLGVKVTKPKAKKKAKR